MKKITIYSILLFIVTISFSCQKEEIPNEQNNQNVSVFSDNDEGEFKKEVVVTDESGNNTAFYRVYSDDNELLEQFIKNNIFELKINIDDINTLKSSNFPLKSEASNIDSSMYNLNMEPKIIIELITTNLQKDVTSYSLDIKKNNLKSTNFLFGYPVGYETSNNFIGASHKNWGYDFFVKRRYKIHWYSSWKYIIYNGANAWRISYDEAIWENIAPSYRLGLIIYPHLYQKGTNYRIAFGSECFRGNDCTIGSYDSENCYVGTPPSGTRAFYYPNNQGNFYYTPVNGNQCPRPGSYFDGANCFVMDIPSTCDAFIWDNKWYVKTDVIPTSF